jgi:hypothetical protein
MTAETRFAGAVHSYLPPCGGGMGVVQYGTAVPHLTTPTAIPAPQGGWEEFVVAANRISAPMRLDPATTLSALVIAMARHG